MARRRVRISIRLVSLFVAFGIALIAIAGRLVQLQIVQAQPLLAMGNNQRIDNIVLPAQRGTIYDRDMTPLAVSTEARAVFANPKLIESPAQAADVLAPVLGVEPGELLTPLSKETSFVYLARKVSPAVADRIADLGLPYVGTHAESQRAYPADALAGQILGFVGTDNAGLSGIESRYEDVLRGTPGQQIVERDPRGRPIPQGRYFVRDPEPGKGLVLTIDRE
ncbi:MAG TPA: stage V sporulation protein D, partial [Actinomycetota bacterium]|nr:stage V sporulation protein D [Actinomycetota bacterium]